MSRKRVCAFDMDGTIADFYGVKGWLEYLNKEDTTPYTVATPLVDVVHLKKYLSTLKAKGVHLQIISWSSKGATDEFTRAIKTAKVNWLKSYGLYEYFDEVHVVKYGTPKHSVCTRYSRKLPKTDLTIYTLYDDDNGVRSNWISAGNRSKGSIFFAVSEAVLKVNCLHAGTGATEKIFPV